MNIPRYLPYKLKFPNGIKGKINCKFDSAPFYSTLDYRQWTDRQTDRHTDAFIHNPRCNFSCIEG